MVIKRRDSKKGFTLIELLVVISIIAMLLSILMPALGRAKEQAMAVVCRTRLKQWGLIFNMYFEEHEGKVPPGRVGMVMGGDPEESGWGMWFRATEHYYENPDMMFCPSATKTTEKGGQQPFRAWHISNDWIDNFPQFQRGSYGYNMWGVARKGGPYGGPTRYPPSPEYDDQRIHNISSLGRPYNTPLMGDSSVMQTWPLDDDSPPEDEGLLESKMAKFCVNRHTKTTNMVFFDGAVHRVGLKTLWQLDWSPGYNKRGIWTPAGGVTASDWPEWMRHYSENLIN